MHQPSYYLIRDRFPSLLHCSLPSLSLLSLQLKFNTTQQFLVPQHVHTIYSHDMQHDSLSFYPDSTAFFIQFFFFHHCILGKLSDSFCMTSIINRLVPATPFLKPSSKLSPFIYIITHFCFCLDKKIYAPPTII